MLPVQQANRRPFAFDKSYHPTLPNLAPRKEDILEDTLSSSFQVMTALFPVNWCYRNVLWQNRLYCFHSAHQGAGLIEWEKCLAGSWRSKIYLFQYWQTPIFKNLALWNKEIQLGFFFSNPPRSIRISGHELPHKSASSPRKRTCLGSPGGCCFRTQCE